LSDLKVLLEVVSMFLSLTIGARGSEGPSSRPWMVKACQHILAWRWLDRSFRRCATDRRAGSVLSDGACANNN